MEAMEMALNMEVHVTEQIILLYEIANDHGDSSVSDSVTSTVNQVEGWSDASDRFGN